MVRRMFTLPALALHHLAWTATITPPNPYQVQFSGPTPLAASMGSKVLSNVVLAQAARGQLAKPVLVITITDGEPTDTPRDAILKVRVGRLLAAARPASASQRGAGLSSRHAAFRPRGSL